MVSKSKILGSSDLKLILICGIILFPIIFFPGFSDQSIFIYAGNILKNGGELYNDFYDLKPPFIYYLFSLLSYVFSDNILLYRLFDFFYQLIFILISIYILRKLKFENIFIYVYTIIFSLSYVILEFTNTLQCETLTFIPFLLYFYYTSKEDNTIIIKDQLILGLLLGILISLKYTFGIILLFYIIAGIKNKDNFKELAAKTILQLLLSLLFLLFTFVPVVLEKDIFNFFNFISIIGEYSGQVSLSAEFIRSMLHVVIPFLSSIFSIAFLCFTAFSFYCYYSNKLFKNEKDLLWYSSIAIIVLSISIIIEGKFFQYHIVRLYPFLLMLTALGVVNLFKLINFKWDIITVSLLIFLILFSPIPRTLNMFKLPYYYFTDKNKYIEINNSPENNIYLKEEHQIAEFINKNYPQKKTLIIAIGIDELLLKLDKMPDFKFPNSVFYLSEGASEFIREVFLLDLKYSDIIVIKTKDILPKVTGYEKTSYERIKEIDLYYDYIDDNFNEVNRVADSYKIFIRKEVNE